MQLFILYLTIFALGCLGGWCLEVIWRRCFKEKTWMNPGFLNGPYLPLYGTGMVFFYYVSGLGYSIYLKALIFVIGPTVIEYLTGVFILKYYKIRLWDYSDRKFHLDGIISPLFSFFWLLLGLFFYYLIYPLISNYLLPLALIDNVIFLNGVFYGLFITDFAFTSGLAKLIKNKLKLPRLQEVLDENKKKEKKNKKTKK